MPIKTIQPFVSNFNAFAGEGFYGNVVQGLVIKQLEDAVFIFGIAIDGTLIFRKRNYPDVSTWEDPKIIIHSNNWHKIYFVTDLGELIGNATSNKSGLMSSGMVPLELSKDNNQYCKISVFMPNAGSINESVISVTNVGGDSFSVAVSMIRWNANKVFCKLINGTKISNINMYYTVDTERFCFYIKANWYAKIIVSRLGLVNTSKIESINAIPSGAIEVPISWRDKRYSTDLGELLENRLVKYKEMNLGANEIIDTGANTGLIRFKINATSASCVFFCNSGSSNIMLITQNVDNYFTTNKSSNSEKIAIYKESDNGNILIKNLTAINYGTFVFYYI